MEIKIKPSDLISRFIWDEYVRFCLPKMSKSIINEIIEKDEEFIISEKDAFVIGLLCVIYTPNVVYKFNQFVKEIIENKTIMHDRRAHLSKELLIDNIRTYKNKIPKDWKSSDIEFNIEMKKLDSIYELFIINVDNLITCNIQDTVCVRAGQVKKIVNKIIK